MLGEEHVLKTPAFADSVSEGDIKWEKSKYTCAIKDYFGKCFKS